MSEININPINELSNFFLSAKKNTEFDLFSYPNKKTSKKQYRKLSQKEIDILINNNNNSENWYNFYVTDKFIPDLIRNSEFYGQIRLGDMSLSFLEYNDLTLPVGIYNSTVISCDIGDNVVVRNVNFLSHYIIGDECILFNINEMVSSDHAKFGNGIVTEGEEEDVRIWLEISNENGGRKILPFEELIPADAYIWSKFRDDKILMNKLITVTENNFDGKRGYYGEVGKKSVIKNSRIIKDTKIGEYSYIKGTNKLKNITILSSKEEPSQIGEGVELVNGIIGYGSKIFYGCKAVRFVTGRNTQLKYGSRLLNSILGDNSTVSCCELLNNLIFPFHEQHHNTSFLIATTILGQSNIAAGATIGSNHNSRAPEGEIIAGRGFWPGLCTSFKHNSKFASFSLIVKGDYQNELNIKYPFSLIYLDKDKEEVQIMPAYWFMYNLYAIARNEYKFKNRDKRKIIVQNIELDFLAPDSVNEILYAISRIEYLTGLSLDATSNISDEKITEKGRAHLKKADCDNLVLNDKESMKKTGGNIIKPQKAWKIYRKMCLYFTVKNIINYFKIDNNIDINNLIKNIHESYKKPFFIKWWNLGGQLVSDEDLTKLKDDIKSGILVKWENIHYRYNELWQKYPQDKLRFSLYACEKIYEKKITGFSLSDWKIIFTDAYTTFEYILKSTIESREKDYIDPFKIMNYENKVEMQEVLGSIKDNDFINNLEKETKIYLEKINYLIK